jgi:hypothetical protein
MSSCTVVAARGLLCNSRSKPVSTTNQEPRATTSSLESKAWIPLLAIFVFGCVRRLSGFDAYWLNPDEGIYFSMVTWNEWGEFWKEYSANTHPPLFYLVARMVSFVTTELWAFRSIAFVCGCLGVPATFLFARECIGRGPIATLTGLFAALLVANSFTAVEMSQLIRPYTMQILFLTCALYFLVRYLRVGGRRCLPAYAGLMIVAIITHYGSLLVFVGIGMTLIGLLAFRRLDARQFRVLLIWNLPVVAASAAVYLLHIRPTVDGSVIATQAVNTWLKPVMIHGVGDVWPRFLGVLSAFGALFEGPTSLVFFAGIGLAVYRKNHLVVLMALTIPAVAIVAAAMQKYPFGYSRHSLYLTMVLVTPIAFALASMFAAAFTGRRGAICAGIGLLVLVAALNFHVEVSRFLGSALRVRDFENTLSRKDLAWVQPALDEISNKPGILLMGVQTHYLLMPFFQQERQKAVATPDASVKRFRWRQRDVLIPQVWNLSTWPGAMGMPIHLHDAIGNIDRQYPELRFSTLRSVGIFVGGWSRLADEIRKMSEEGTPEERKLVKGGGSVNGLSAFEFDIAAYKAMMDRKLKKGR